MFLTFMLAASNQKTPFSHKMHWLLLDALSYLKLIGDVPKYYPTGGSFDTFSFAQLYPSYTGSGNYTASLWANRGALANTDNTLFRVSQTK